MLQVHVSDTINNDNGVCQGKRDRCRRKMPSKQRAHPGSVVMVSSAVHLADVPAAGVMQQRMDEVHYHVTCCWQDQAAG
jgi:hypothetical protein